MQGVTCNMKWELADALAVNPEADIKPIDSFHIKFGADPYYAWHKIDGNDKITLDTTSNAIGAYTPSNNVYLKVVYKWNNETKR